MSEAKKDDEKLDPQEDDVFAPPGDGATDEKGGEKGEKKGVLALNKKRIAGLGIAFAAILFGVALFGVYGGGEKSKKKKKAEKVGPGSGTSAAEQVEAIEERNKEVEKPADKKAEIEARSKKEKKMDRAEQLQKKLEKKVGEEDKKKGGEGKKKKGPWEKAQEQAKRRRARSYFREGFDADRANIFAQVETPRRKVEKRGKDKRIERKRGSEGMSPGEMQRQMAKTRERLVAQVGQEQGGGGSAGVTQQEKFLEETNAGQTQNFHRLQGAVSEYAVQAGTMLPLVLETGIDSELPGFIRGRFARPIYDTVTGEHLLIPSGSTIVGKYNARTEEGQSRAQVVWTRLLLPNGKSIKLGGIPGADLQGQSGYHDKVDNQWGEVGAGVVLTSLLSAGAGAASGTQSDFRKRPEQGALNAVGQNVSKTGEDIVGRELDKKPVVKIRPGLEVSAFVHEDLVLEPYRRK